MDIDDVHKSMIQILKDKKTLNMRQLEVKWAAFMNEFPLIFISLCREDVDLSMLNVMIQKIKQVRMGEKAHDTAEKEFGNIMADKYIYPTFEKPSEEQLKVAYDNAVKNKEKELNSIYN